MMNFPFGLAYFGQCKLVISGSAKGLLRLFFFWEENITCCRTKIIAMCFCFPRQKIYQRKGGLYYKMGPLPSYTRSYITPIHGRANRYGIYPSRCSCNPITGRGSSCRCPRFSPTLPTSSQPRGGLGSYLRQIGFAGFFGLLRRCPPGDSSRDLFIP